MNPAARPVPFRAGRQAEENALGATELAQVMPPDFGPDAVLLADVSEFQPEVDAAYLGWSKAIIIRAMYGDAHDDGAWYGGARRAFLHEHGARFLGIYQYLAAAQDPAAQARSLIALLGKLEPGEKVIADIEEGLESQAARWEAWSKTIQDGLGDDPWDYSGEYFASVRGLSPVSWVAAYGTAEPAVRHQLWQFTDAYTVPGIAGLCDCSVFHGTLDELAALAAPGTGRWAFPAPAGLHVTRQTRSGVTLAWQPVTRGKTPPSSYSAYTWAGQRLAAWQNDVRGTATAEYGPSGRGLPAGTYQTHVWANGGPSAPPHASVSYTLQGLSWGAWPDQDARRARSRSARSALSTRISGRAAGGMSTRLRCAAWCSARMASGISLPMTGCGPSAALRRPLPVPASLHTSATPETPWAPRPAPSRAI